MKNISMRVLPGVRYLAFDKHTGRILHTHSRFSVEKNEYTTVPLEELKGMIVSDHSIVEELTDHDPKNLDVIQVKSEEATGGEGGMMVDVAHRTLVPLPTLSVTASKKEIQGDGKDSAKIDVRVLGADGKLLSKFKGQVKVTTTRGKLSARGGIVDLTDGLASITLTSVPETVSSVRVLAAALNGLCTAGYVTVEFV